ncbi:hypothetical protein LJR225_004311 [Phenylobacterium sp. LjRoot225]|uniref:hypothetical protein n=1 Tax=Phenylobacterium sp. LjRoot225 TaxID=3342285 RepID=UPI003ECEE0E0
MANFLFYGINEAGEIVFSQLLRDFDRADLRALADARLQDWHAVEVWEGPVCLVRLRRAPAN